MSQSTTPTVRVVIRLGNRATMQLESIANSESVHYHEHMNTSEIESRLAHQRKRLLLSQKAAAQRIGVGRTTVVAMENGHIGRVSFGVVDAYANSLDLPLQPVSRDDAARADHLERQLVRLEHAVALERQKNRHLRLAMQLTPAGVRDARKQVNLWSERNTCSQFYIDQWRDMLSGSPSAVARKIAKCAESEWANALFQNSPFVEGGR